MNYLKSLALCCICMSLWQGVMLTIASSPTATASMTAMPTATNIDLSTQQPTLTIITTFTPTLTRVPTDLPMIQATLTPSFTSTVKPTDLPTIQVTPRLSLTSTLVPVTSTPTVFMAITATEETPVQITPTVTNVSPTSFVVGPSVTPVETVTPTIISAATSTPILSITPIASETITPTLDITSTITGTLLTTTPIIISPTQTEISPTLSASPLPEIAIVIGQIEHDLEEVADIHIDILQDSRYLQTIKSDSLGNFAVTLPHGIYEFVLVSDGFLNTSDQIEMAQDTHLTCYLVYGDLNQDGIIDLLDVGILQSMNQIEGSEERLQKLFLIAQGWQGQKISSCS